MSPRAEPARRPPQDDDDPRALCPGGVSSAGIEGSLCRPRVRVDPALPSGEYRCPCDAVTVDLWWPDEQEEDPGSHPPALRPDHDAPELTLVQGPVLAWGGYLPARSRYTIGDLSTWPTCPGPPCDPRLKVSRTLPAGDYRCPCAAVTLRLDWSDQQEPVLTLVPEQPR